MRQWLAAQGSSVVLTLAVMVVTTTLVSAGSTYAGSRFYAARAPSLTLTSIAHTERATLLAKPFCPQPPIGEPCSAPRYDPKPRGKLPIKARLTVRITTDPAVRMTVSLERPDRARTNGVRLGGGPAWRIDRSARHWRFSVPRQLRGASYLQITVAYAKMASQSFVVGVRSQGLRRNCTSRPG